MAGSCGTGSPPDEVWTDVCVRVTGSGLSMTCLAECGGCGSGCCALGIVAQNAGWGAARGACYPGAVCRQGGTGRGGEGGVCGWCAGRPISTHATARLPPPSGIKGLRAFWVSGQSCVLGCAGWDRWGQGAQQELATLIIQLSIIIATTECRGEGGCGG